MKIIKINGFKGMITALFIVVCLFAGFVIFPGYVAMTLWNKYLVTLMQFPALSIFQGILLWSIAFLCYMILNKDGFAVSFKESHQLSNAELDMIMKNARIYSNMKKINKIISQSDKFEKHNNVFYSDNKGEEIPTVHSSAEKSEDTCTNK